VKLLTTCITALFAILLFFDTTKDEAGIQNVQGSLFFITMNIAFNAIQNVILIFPDERPVFLREVNNNMYKTAPYFWAKIISELPFSILTPTIFGVIVYYAIGYNPDASNFVMFLLILILIYNASSGYSLIISASFSDKQLAVTLTPVLIIPFMLFAGFFVSSDNIPIFLKEFEYLSIFKYGYESLMHNQFDAYNPATPGTTCTYPCWCANTCDPLSQISADSNRWSSMMALALIYFGCYMIAWAILTCLSSKYE
jgi:ABC-type multidrug transport system permease subunit